MKRNIAIWLNSRSSTTMHLDPEDRKDRGLQNDIMGRLLCPIDFDWDNPECVPSVCVLVTCSCITVCMLKYALVMRTLIHQLASITAASIPMVMVIQMTLNRDFFAAPYW
jgi:hypothetical protein